MIDQNKKPEIIQKILYDEQPLLSYDASAEEEIVVMAPSKFKDACETKVSQQIKKNKDLSLADHIKEVSKEIRNITDCDAIRQYIYNDLFGLTAEQQQLNEETPKELDRLLGLTNVPLNPFSIPKYIVKHTIAKIVPDIKALVDLIKRITEVISAMDELITTIDSVQPRLKQCSIMLKQESDQTKQNEIRKEVEYLKGKIIDKISDAICEGLTEGGATLEEFMSVFEIESTINDLVTAAKQVKSDAEYAMENSISTIGRHQSSLETLTGVPSPMNTANTSAFLESISSTEYTQWESDVDGLLLLPDPVNDTLPVISGDVVVGATLSCSNGVWTANGTANTSFNFSWQWYRNGVQIDGANTYTYVPVMDDVEYPLHCMVTAENQVSLEQAQSEKTGPVAVQSNSTTIPVISGIAGVGNTLSCSTGLWPFTPTIIQYEWTRIVPAGTNTVVQSLSGNSSYYVKAGDAGYSLICKVVASSFRYVVPQLSANTAVVT